MTMEQFIDLCILAGCDYCDTIRGAALCNNRPTAVALSVLNSFLPVSRLCLPHV